MFSTHITSLHWLVGVIALSAIIATASVFLVFQLGQPRIWYEHEPGWIASEEFFKHSS
jgi:amino acid transporter